MRVLLEQATIQASSASAWRALADFGDVAAWAPYMRSSCLIGSQQTGVGTRREMKHELGFRFEEQVTGWEEGKGLSFDVRKAPWPMKDVRESWQLMPENRSCQVVTRVEYDMRLGPVGAFLDWILVRFIVRREMRSGVRGLKEYLEATG
jgi:hypothetical protein